MPRDQRNAYYCNECRGYIVTIDLDEGVTPMFLACRVAGEAGHANPCQGTMQSMMYPQPPWPETDGYGTPIPTEPTWEWYSPDRNEYRRLDMQVKEHVDLGGLLLRER